MSAKSGRDGCHFGASLLFRRGAVRGHRVASLLWGSPNQGTFAVRDPVENDLERGQLGSLDGVPLRIPVQRDIQLRNLYNPAAIDFQAELVVSFLA